MQTATTSVDGGEPNADAQPSNEQSNVPTKTRTEQSSDTTEHADGHVTPELMVTRHHQQHDHLDRSSSSNSSKRQRTQAMHQRRTLRMCRRTKRVLAVAATVVVVVVVSSTRQSITVMTCARCTRWTVTTDASCVRRCQIFALKCAN